MSSDLGKAGPGPLVSADWLASRPADPQLRILDIRSAVDGGGRQAYEQAHIPGAVHTDYVKDGWRSTSGMATGLLPSAEHLAQLFGRLGLAPDRPTVIVSAGTSPGDFSAAARVYWTLKTARHRVSILDGGMAAWASDPTRPVETGEGQVPPATHDLVTLNTRLRADLRRVEQAVASHDAVLLDSRAASYFEGREQSPQTKRAGRLPGALHLNHVLAFDANKRLRPVSELRALFAGVPDAPVVNYCNTGHQAATNWFILSELLGRPDVMLYDGSMTEWTEDPSRPVMTGDE